MTHTDGILAPVTTEGASAHSVISFHALSGLSVIIPSFQSSYLSEILESVKGLHPREIIVVDSSPEKPVISDPAVTLIHSPTRLTPGAARNLGAKRSIGGCLLFVDSDVLLGGKACEFVESFLKEGTERMIAGLYSIESRGGLFSRLQNHIVRYRLRKSAKFRTPLLSSAVLIVRRDVFLRVGGFNEDIRTYEDIEFAARAAAMGHSLGIEPAFEAQHLKEYSLRSLLVDYYRKAVNAFQVRRRFPSVFRSVSPMLSIGLLASWAPGCVLALLSPMLLFPALWPTWGALAVIAMVLPIPFLNSLLEGEALGSRLLVAMTWPLFGPAIGLAVIRSAAFWYLSRAWKTVVWATDLARSLLRVVLRNGMPVQLIAYVTARCNLRCEHCFYKETLDAPNPGEIPLETFDRTTRSIGPVLWFSLGGGEPFLRKDLAELVNVIQTNCRPQILSFPTNGWYTDKTFETTLRVLHKIDGNFMLFFSLDGPREIHDEIRGAGSFDRVKATMDRLRPLTALYPNLYLNVVTTVTERNSSFAAGFIEELVRDFKPSAISINLFRYHSLDHPPLAGSLLQGYHEAVSTYTRYLRKGALKHYGFFGGRILFYKEILQKDLIYRVAKNNEFVTPCTAGTLSYVIMEDGRVSPCEILPDTLGNVHERDFAEMTKSREAKQMRNWIRETKCKCTYECAMSTNTLFSWPMSRRLIKALVQDTYSNV